MLLMKKPWKWVIVSLALLVVFVVASTAVSLQSRFHARDEAAATATRFLSALDAHDYTGAHTLLDVSQQQAITLSAMQKAEEDIEKKHGKTIGKPIVDEYHPSQDLTSVTLSCDNAYQRGGGPIRVVMAKTPDGWRVSEYRYDFSPA